MQSATLALVVGDVLVNPIRADTGLTIDLEGAADLLWAPVWVLPVLQGFSE